MTLLLRAIRLRPVNGPGKFLISAAGEITLVMIGILLAMQVNNWNEERKAQREEQAFLKAIKKEMADNLSQLKSTISYNERSKDAAFKLLQIYSGNYTEFRHSVLDSLLAEVQWTWTFDPELSILNSIKANGKISIIQNLVIQSFLSSFEEATKDSEEESLITRSLIIDKYVMLVSRYISVNTRGKYLGYTLPKTKFQADYHGLFNDRGAESILSYIYIWRVDELEELKNLQQKLIENLAVVEKEIR